MSEPTDKPPPPQAAQVEADSDPDFDDLDDVLDQFSANTSSQPKPPSSDLKPSSSGPGRPEPDLPVPTGLQPNESEDDFIKRLTAEMSSVMGQMSNTTNEAASSEDLVKMGKELEDFTHKMEAEGIKPEDLLKAILGEETGTKVGEAAHEEKERRESESKSKSPEPKQKPSPDSKNPASFEDTIRRTINRLESSSQAATSATQTQPEEDMLADLLKSLETGGEGQEGGDLSKMFLGMMEQLTNKDMLYEPMLELHQKFPAWLDSNKSKVSAEDLSRYEKQKEIVGDIVAKFQEKGYSDEDAKRREYIWEKMQLMQEQGAPPEELVQAPGGLGLPGLGGGAPGEEGCPTQ